MSDSRKLSKAPLRRPLADVGPVIRAAMDSYTDTAEWWFMWGAVGRWVYTTLHPAEARLLLPPSSEVV